MTYQRTSSDFSSLPIDSIVDNSTTDFDLFLEVLDHQILYGSEEGYKWYKDELTRLLGNGYSQFHVYKEDLHKVKAYLKMASLPKLEKDLAPKQRIRNIEDVGVSFTKALYAGEITKACVEQGRAIAEAMIACISEDPKCIQELAGLASHDYYTYHHSVRVACFSTAIAIEMGLSKSGPLEEIALGGLFHDIGKKEVGLEVINKTGALTKEEWLAMRSHPETGARLVDQSALPLVPREIILHHHEKLDGSGYPHGIDQGSLLTEVKIATLADVYDALTSSRSYQNKRSRYEALDFIKHKLLGRELALEPYKALISALTS